MVVMLDESTAITYIFSSGGNPSNGEILLSPLNGGYPIYGAYGWMFCYGVILSLPLSGRVSAYEASE